MGGDKGAIERVRFLSVAEYFLIIFSLPLITFSTFF